MQNFKFLSQEGSYIVPSLFDVARYIHEGFTTYNVTTNNFAECEVPVVYPDYKDIKAKSDNFQICLSVVKAAGRSCFVEETLKQFQLLQKGETKYITSTPKEMYNKLGCAYTFTHLTPDPYMLPVLQDFKSLELVIILLVLIEMRSFQVYTVQNCYMLLDCYLSNRTCTTFDLPMCSVSVLHDKKHVDLKYNTETDRFHPKGKATSSYTLSVLRATVDFLYNRMSIRVIIEKTAAVNLNTSVCYFVKRVRVTFVSYARTGCVVVSEDMVKKVLDIGHLAIYLHPQGINSRVPYVETVRSRDHLDYDYSISHQILIKMPFALATTNDDASKYEVKQQRTELGSRRAAPVFKHVTMQELISAMNGKRVHDLE